MFLRRAQFFREKTAKRKKPKKSLFLPILKKSLKQVIMKVMIEITQQKSDSMNPWKIFHTQKQILFIAKQKYALRIWIWIFTSILLHKNFVKAMNFDETKSQLRAARLEKTNFL